MNMLTERMAWFLDAYASGLLVGFFVGVVQRLMWRRGV